MTGYWDQLALTAASKTIEILWMHKTHAHLVGCSLAWVNGV